MLRAQFAVAARGDDQELLAFEGVGHGSGLATSRKFKLPELLAGFRIEGSEIIVHGSGREHEAACANHWSAESDGSRIHARNPASQRDVPDFFPREKIDGGNSAPGRRVAWKSARREKRRSKHAVRCAGLPRKFSVEPVGIAGVLAGVFELCAGN